MKTALLRADGFEVRHQGQRPQVLIWILLEKPLMKSLGKPGTLEIELTEEGILTGDEDAGVNQ